MDKENQMQLYSIYKIINNVNGKIYIGFSQDPNFRWKRHKTMKGARGTETRGLYRAFRKYGIDNFSFEIIYQSLDRIHTLCEMETYFIKEYNSYGTHGYNMTKGGGNPNTDKMRENARQRMLYNNPMTKLKINKGSFSKGHKPIITPERNEKIRISKLGKRNHNFQNPLAAIPLNILVTCEKCGNSMNKGNYNRWHGNNCKGTYRHYIKI